MIEKGNFTCVWVGVFIVIGASGVFGKYSNGSGTEQDPYRISTVADWQELINTPDDWDKHFILTADLDFGGVTIMPVARDTVDGSGFDGTPFTGRLNGKGFVLRNAEISGHQFVGLFGYIGAGGQILNLGIEDIDIWGYGSIGGLCGYNENGTITTCYSTGAVNGGNNSRHLGGLCGYNKEGTINSCYATGAVHCGYGLRNATIGGLCGCNDYGTITACYSTGSVSGDWGASYLGGLCGGNSGAIENCYATGNIIGNWFTDYLGGLCGSNSGAIENCCAKGSVTGGNDSNDLGGFCGNNSAGMITNCYSTGVITWGTNPRNIGGFAGRCGSIFNCYYLITSGPDNGCGTPLTDSEMKQQSSFIGWDFIDEVLNGSEDIWRMCVDGIEYPKLYWQFLTGDFTCPDGVGMMDLAYFIGFWLEVGCNESNNYCGRTDINQDGKVDLTDWSFLAGNWLR